MKSGKGWILLALLFLVVVGIGAMRYTKHAYKAPPHDGPVMTWTPYSENAVKAAAEAGQPVVIDFYADWCPGCHVLDQTVFRDPDVQKRLESFVRLRLNATDMRSPGVQYVLDQYGVVGLPTVIFLNARGDEINKTRIEGAGSINDFLPALLLAEKHKS